MKDKLSWLGFTAGEIRIAMIIRDNEQEDRTPSVNKIQKIFNVDYRTAQRTRYLYTIMIGHVSINIDNLDNLEELKPIAKHFNKINDNRIEKTYLSNLKPSKVINIPRIAVVRGIEAEPYNVFNTNNIGSIKEFMSVDRITPNSMTLKTMKKIVLKYDRKGNYGIDGVIKVIGKDTKNRTVIEVNREYCRLCNRYEIVASLIMPKNHLGVYGVVTAAGDIIYIYAKNVKATSKINKSESERVYDFGIMPNQIKQRLERVAKSIYIERKGVFCKYFPAQVGFRIISNDKRVLDDEIEV